MAFPLFFYLFPNGRFVPHWTRWLLIDWVLWAIIDTFFHNAPFSRSAWFLALESLLFVVGLSSMILAQAYRYRYVSGPAQRQQTKWVVFGMGIGLGGFFVSGIFGFILPAVLFPLLAPAAMPSPALMGIIAITASYVTMLFTPLSLLMAMLRSQLWEIDGIVSRVLLYSSLTAVLALIYIGSIILLQQVFRPFTSQDDLVLIGSTLAIVALFQPLQRRLQKVIDRRFYRQKYDAAQTLELFSATLQEETDLTQLSEQIIDVVEEAMQPAHVALWLCHSEPGTAAPKYTRHLRL
jgi:hypothetical protein